MNTSSSRPVTQTTSGHATRDGAGVSLTRLIGTPELDMLDPFLLFDHFASDRPDDYIAGFPDHPHRGFETVTYLTAGRMRHRDSAGNEGVIEPGGVQWMTAGRGIVHSEMPEQVEGLLSGFQLWVNLPRLAKMTEPAYQEFDPASVPVEEGRDGQRIRVVAGTSDAGTVGPVKNEHVRPIYLDVSLPAGSGFRQTVSESAQGFLYCIDGTCDAGTRLAGGTLALLGAGTAVAVDAITDCRFLLIAGEPLGEPVTRAGPFVMNSKAEIMQAFDDYQQGRIG